MLKKLSMILMSCLIVIAFSAGGIAEAKTSYKSPRSSYSPGATKPPAANNGVNRADPSVSKSPGATTGANPANRGFFSGGGLMRGLLIGGVAGMLFGGLFGNMGALGNILGLMINLLAIVVVVIAVIRIISYFRNRNRYDNRPNRY